MICMLTSNLVINKENCTGRGLQPVALCERWLSTLPWRNLVFLCTIKLKHLKFIPTSGPLHLLFPHPKCSSSRPFCGWFPFSSARKRPGPQRGSVIPDCRIWIAHLCPWAKPSLDHDQVLFISQHFYSLEVPEIPLVNYLHLLTEYNLQKS